MTVDKQINKNKKDEVSLFPLTTGILKFIIGGLCLQVQE